MAPNSKQVAHILGMSPCLGSHRMCLKIHIISVFLVLATRALIHFYGFLNLATCLRHLATGPCPLECHLILETTLWHPGVPNTLLQPASSWSVMVALQSIYKAWKLPGNTLPCFWKLGPLGQPRGWFSHLRSSTVPDR